MFDLMFGLLSLFSMTSDATVTNGHTKHECSSKKEWVRLNVGGQCVDDQHLINFVVVLCLLVVHLVNNDG